MLLEFKVENYKSFLDECTFSMEKAPMQKDLEYSLLSESICRKEYKGLSSSVIYGPNAAGKTNIIGAMDVFRAIVLRGNIRNAEDDNSPNRASFHLELIPNNALKESKPVSFRIKFINNSCLVEYLLSIDLGDFMSASVSRKIISEELLINEKQIFYRTNTVKISNLESLSDFIPMVHGLGADYAQDVLDNGLDNEELFLTNGFKLVFSQSLVRMITDWFAKKFMVIYRSDSMQYIKRYDQNFREDVYIEKVTNQAAMELGACSNELKYLQNKNDNSYNLFSLLKNAKNDENFAVAAETFESYGTIRFVNLFPLIVKAIKNGCTLIVDEFDASIHPIALMSLINIFHNDDINVNKAQLIFNTHNPIFLNSNLFRRDEIKFVERSEKNGSSTIYSLSDFGTSGENGVRKTDDYMKNYFISKYGAIKDIDFTPIFEDIIAKNEGV